MITIVSGLPRSGTSLMMQILEKGGVEVLTDNLRAADENNQKGYYEFEKVKGLMKDSSWVVEAEGKVVKVIAQLLNFLPDNLNYRVIFMDRDLDEVLKSQMKMISNLGTGKAKLSPELLKKTFIKQISAIKNTLKENNKIKLLEVSHRGLIKRDIDEFKKIMEFCDLDCNIENLISVVDRDMYRERV